MVNTTYKTTEDMIDKLQQLKGKTKLKFYKNISNYYDNMNIRFDEDPFAKNAEGISKIYLKVLFLNNFLQTKPQVKNMNNTYYDLYYTVIKNTDDEETTENQYESDFFSLINVIIPNRYVGIKN